MLQNISKRSKIQTTKEEQAAEEEEDRKGGEQKDQNRGLDRR
jgi:hypothetical protein